MALPFLTKPKAFEMIRVGNPEIGEIELPKFGDLSVNERIFIKNCTKHLPDLQQLAANLADKIAKDSGKKMLDVYNALTSGDVEFLGEHLKEALEFNTQFSDYTEARRAAIATAMLRRIQPDWTLEQTGDPTQLPPGLLLEVADFGYNEEMGWPEKKEPEAVTDETLGKSSAENIEPKSRTGKKSTGESNPTGPTIDDSQPSLLDSSPSV